MKRGVKVYNMDAADSYIEQFDIKTENIKHNIKTKNCYNNIEKNINKEIKIHNSFCLENDLLKVLCLWVLNCGMQVGSEWNQVRVFADAFQWSFYLNKITLYQTLLQL